MVAHASSTLTDFMRRIISSGTFGRPSAKRSPLHKGVKAINCSLLICTCCACTGLQTAAIVHINNRHFTVDMDNGFMVMINYCLFLLLLWMLPALVYRQAGDYATSLPVKSR